MIKDQGEKQISTLKFLDFSDKQLPSTKDFISKEKLNPEIFDEIKKIEEEKRKVDRSKMVYQGSKENYGNEIRNSIIDMSMANDEQNQLSKYIREFKSKVRT